MDFRRKPAQRAQDLSPDIPFVKFHAMVSQQGEKFILKRDAMVMPRLVPYVTNHRLTPGFAHDERPVPALPRKGPPFRPPLFQPTRRIRLYHSHAVRNRKAGGQAGQHVNVIGCATYRNGGGMQFAQNSPEVGMHIRPNRVGKKRRPAGGGEDDMREQAGEGVSHSYAPSGLRCEMQPLYPRLAPWGYRLLPAARAGLGYFRALPTGGRAAAITAAPESIPANRCPPHAASR